MKRRRRMCASICLLMTGIILISVGISIFLYFETIYDFIINNALSFNPSSEPFRAWKTNDPPLTMDIYLFNWTNPKELRTPGSKPKFQEIGPYRFFEVREKIDVKWHNHNNTISYRHKKNFFFDAENSPRQLNDTISIINIVPLAIAYKARNFGYFSKRTISYSISSLSSLYVTKSAGEILFEGYEESILSILSSVPLAGVQDKFGIFYGRNNSVGYDGDFSMWTRNDDSFGKIVSWNHKQRMDFFEGHCNDIRGSAGEFYPINRKRDYLEFFSPELCRIAKLEYERDVVIKGVKGYKYTARNMFDNGTLNKANSCYCRGECLPTGVLNVSACRQDTPTFLSMPHFYGADPHYINSIEGIDPDDNHEFYIILEPKSGIVIDIGARMQVNMLLQPIDYITLYKDVPKIVFPIFYFDQVVTLRDDLAPKLKLIQDLPDYANIGVLILIILGLMSIICAGLNYLCCSKNEFEQQQEHKITPNNVEEIPLRS